jgi:non-heme chloroperoxidase
LLPNHSAAVDAEDLAALITTLGLGQVHVVGYSYGAYAGLILALQHPDLVRSVTLAEPPIMSWLADLPEGAPLLNESMERCWTPARRAFERGDAQGGIRFFVDHLVGEGRYDQLSERVRKDLHRNRRAFGALVLSDDRYPAVNRDQVRAIGVPTLLLYGERTHTAAQLVRQELVKLIPKEMQTLVVVPDATHALWSQEPERCRQAVLDFLAGK